MTTIATTTRWLDQGDGTVIDTTTGLMWMRPLLGQFVGDEGSVVGEPLLTPLSDAPTAARASLFAGRCDWRVPVIGELVTLVEGPEGSARMDERIFGVKNLGIWSLSPAHFSELYACFLSAHYGCVGHQNRSKPLQVRLVRDCR